MLVEPVERPGIFGVVNRRGAGAEFYFWREVAHTYSVSSSGSAASGNVSSLREYGLA